MNGREESDEGKDEDVMEDAIEDEDGECRWRWQLERRRIWQIIVAVRSVDEGRHWIRQGDSKETLKKHFASMEQTEHRNERSTD